MITTCLDGNKSTQYDMIDYANFFINLGVMHVLTLLLLPLLLAYRWVVGEAAWAVA